MLAALVSALSRGAASAASGIGSAAKAVGSGINSVDKALNSVDKAITQASDSATGAFNSLLDSVGNTVSDKASNMFTGTVNYDNQEISVKNGMAMHGGKAYQTDGRFVFEGGKLIGDVDKDNNVQPATGATLSDLLRPSTPNDTVLDALKDNVKETGSNASVAPPSVLAEQDTIAEADAKRQKGVDEMTAKTKQSGDDGSFDQFVNAGLGSFQDFAGNKTMQDMMQFSQADQV